MKIFWLTLAVAMLIVVPATTIAHPGRLDGSGGHNCTAKSQEKGLCTKYHYHNADGSESDTPPGSSSATESTQEAPAPAPSAPTTTQPKPVPKPSTPTVETKEVTESEPISFETKTEEDSSLEVGVTETRQEGKEGMREIVYKVTYTDGQETSRKKVSESIVDEPVEQIQAIGTKEEVVETPPEPSIDSPVADSQSSSGSGALTLLGAIIVGLIGLTAYRSQRSK